ncbi:MAG: DUF3891 family protein, partial [Acidimicrobiia bacterium]|nr:DUF3891 family protein [Acidimicrobiia bacterium]
VDGDEVALDPWPFAVDAFEAPVWGRVLDRGRFGSSVEYRAALSEAPVLERRWRVVNARTGA